MNTRRMGLGPAVFSTPPALAALAAFAAFAAWAGWAAEALAKTGGKAAAAAKEAVTSPQPYSLAWAVVISVVALGGICVVAFKNANR